MGRYWTRAAILVLLGLMLSGAFYLVVRPWQLQRGVTPAERAMRLPGDELVAAPWFESTRAITINAPASQIWPWLAQVGTRRAGWYNFDFINTALGATMVDGRSSTRIVPELQNLRHGDVVDLFPGVAYSTAIVDPGLALVFQGSSDLATAPVFGAKSLIQSDHVKVTHAFCLRAIDASHTRVIARYRLAYDANFVGFIAHNLLSGMANSLQEWQMLIGLKQRAEALRR